MSVSLAPSQERIGSVDGNLDLLGLIVKVCLRAYGPHQLLWAAQPAVHYTYLIGEDAAVAMDEQRRRVDAIGGADAIEQQPWRPRQRGHFVLPRGDRAARRIRVV